MGRGRGVQTLSDRARRERGAGRRAARLLASSAGGCVVARTNERAPRLSGSLPRAAAVQRAEAEVEKERGDDGTGRPDQHIEKARDPSQNQKSPIGIRGLNPPAEVEPARPPGDAEDEESDQGFERLGRNHFGKGKATFLTLRGTRTRQRKAPLRGGAPQAGAAEGRGGLRPQTRVKKLGVFTDPIIILGYVTVGYTGRNDYSGSHPGPLFGRTSPSAVTPRRPPGRGSREIRDLEGTHRFC